MSKHIIIEYDHLKNAQNRLKHGVDFEDASLVLSDPCAVILEDKTSKLEQRFIAVGIDALGRILTVIYTYRKLHVIRLISARKATKGEQRTYAR